jgi:hypothetical protein
LEATSENRLSENHHLRVSTFLFSVICDRALLDVWIWPCIYAAAPQSGIVWTYREGSFHGTDRLYEMVHQKAHSPSPAGQGRSHHLSALGVWAKACHKRCPRCVRSANARGMRRTWTQLSTVASWLVLAPQGMRATISLESLHDNSLAWYAFSARGDP